MIFIIELHFNYHWKYHRPSLGLHIEKRADGFADGVFDVIPVSRFVGRSFLGDNFFHSFFGGIYQVEILFDENEAAGSHLRFADNFLGFTIDNRGDDKHPIFR